MSNPVLSAASLRITIKLNPSNNGSRKCNNPVSQSPLDGTLMILELADIRIHPGQKTEFDAAIQRGLAEVVSKARGFHGYKVNKSVESPERYVLMIFWEALENHTVDFRQSEAFQQWRAIVGPYFAAAPVVEHFTLLTKSD
jgi:heme-degrading monooxygenase HmoA